VLGQPVIVENKAGAAGNVAVEYVARSAPDGYTFVAVASSHATNVNLYSKLGYDPVKDFAPVSLLTTNFFVLVVPAASPARSLSDLVALAKKKGGINYASAGAGQGNHLGMELLRGQAGFDAVHVPYSGIGPATVAVLGQQVDAALLTPPGAMPHVKEGKLRVLEITAPKRSRFMPDVPTIAELGYPGYELSGWIALFAPARTPQPIIDRMQQEVARVMKDPDVVAKLETVMTEPSGSTPQQLADFLQSEIKVWGKVIKQSGAKVD